MKDGWIRIKLLNIDEVRHCIRKLLEKEPFMTKQSMIGALHHITITRYMRHYNAENPMADADRSYKLNGMDRVNEHNSELLKQLYREGFIKYEKHDGKYWNRGRNYTHYIIKIND